MHHSNVTLPYQLHAVLGVKLLKCHENLVSVFFDCLSLADLNGNVACANGGSCSIVNMAPVCSCSQQFTGTRCETALSKNCQPSMHSHNCDMVCNIDVLFLLGEFGRTGTLTIPDALCDATLLEDQTTAEYRSLRDEVIAEARQLNLIVNQRRTDGLLARK